MQNFKCIYAIARKTMEDCQCGTGIIASDLSLVEEDKLMCKIYVL
jgi:hypothetical protein